MAKTFDPNGAADGGLRDTLSRWLLKPARPGAPGRPAPKDRPLDELEDAHRYADDKERAVGLLGAPVATLIGLVVARHVHGTVTSRTEVLLVALVLALAMLALAWFRKRTYLGIVMALYGLSIFSLGFWGFGVPFAFVGAWLLVRAYRAQRDLSEATAPSPARSRAGGRGSSTSARSASGRYTPPAARRRR